MEPVTRRRPDNVVRSGTKRTLGLAALILGSAAAVTVALLSAPAATGAPAAVAEPIDRDFVVAAVGDIACSPEDPAFGAGKGSGLRCRQTDTAQAAAGLNPDAVLALGDNSTNAASSRPTARPSRPVGDAS